MLKLQLTAVVFCASFALIVNEELPTATDFKTVIESIVNKCASDQWNQLEKIHLPKLNVKHLIVGADVFDVYLDELKVTGIDSFQINSVFLSPSEDKEIDVSLGFPRVSLDCMYSANGSIGETFQVNGKGSLRIEYTNITSVFGFAINESVLNGKRMQLITEDGIRGKSLDYEQYLLIAMGNSSEQSLRIDRKGNSRSNGEASQLSQLLFWKLAKMTSSQLKPSFQICIDNQLSKIKYSLGHLNAMKSDLNSHYSQLLYTTSSLESPGNIKHMWYIPTWKLV